MAEATGNAGASGRGRSGVAAANPLRVDVAEPFTGSRPMEVARPFGVPCKGAASRAAMSRGGVWAGAGRANGSRMGVSRAGISRGGMERAEADVGRDAAGAGGAAGSGETSSAMMRRMEARISSMDGSLALALTDMCCFPIAQTDGREQCGRAPHESLLNTS